MEGTSVEPPKGRRRRVVVIERKVSPAEFERHREEMESLGLDPSEPAPPRKYVQGGVDHETSNIGLEPTLANVSKDIPQALTFANSDANVRGPVRIKDGKKQVSLQRRTIEEQSQSERHERSFDRWQRQQADWERFHSHAAKKTGRAKHDLVVSRAEEHRERSELMELVDRATSEEVKSGGQSWYHSLRGEGTRFVQVGNMFSGLYMPIKLHKENVQHEIIRKPGLRDLVNSRTIGETGERRGPKTWRDCEHLQGRVAKYKNKMRELAPGQLEFHELLEPEIIPLRPPIGDAVEVAVDEEAATGLDGSRELPEAASPLPDKDVASQCEELDGPNIQASPDKLQFDTGVKKLSTQSIQLKNVGTAVVQYEWVLNIATHGFQESLLPDDPTVRFTCDTTVGQILPGAESQTLFTFTSSTPGVFTSSWSLKTYPALLKPINQVLMHGVAVEADLLQEQREDFQKSLFQQQILHQVEELVDDIVDSVKLPAEPPVDFTSPCMQERYFEELNMDLELFWSPHAWRFFCDFEEKIQRLKQNSTREKSSATAPQSADIGDAACVNKVPARGRQRLVKPKVVPPAEVRNAQIRAAVPIVKQLLEQLRAVQVEADSESAKERRMLEVELLRAIRAAQVRPLERSPIWWMAYEAVTEIALALPDRWAAVRKSADLAPLPFVAPPEVSAPPQERLRYEQRLAQRRALRGEEEKEAEALAKIQESFVEQFGSSIAGFEVQGQEALVVDRIESAISMSLASRLQPYLKRQGLDNVDMAGGVIFYQADVGWVRDKRSDGVEGEVVELDMTDETTEQMRQRLQGVVAALEANPLALVIVGHHGAPHPDLERAPIEELDAAAVVEPAEDAPEPLEEAPKLSEAVERVKSRMKSLASLELLMDTVRELCEGTASSVEFVPHEVWLGDPASFAERVRSDAAENKVFLLENMAAICEESGIRRISKETTGDLEIQRLPWATRESWASEAFKELQPDHYVLDSFPMSFEVTTLNCGKWPGAPNRVMGYSIENELTTFVEKMELTFSSGKEDMSTTEGVEVGGFAAPLLAVIGGGGFTVPSGEDVLLRKLELLLGVAHFVHHERGGLIIALGGELAIYIIVHVLGVRLGNAGGKPSAAAVGAMKDIVLEVLRLGVTLQLPADFVCEKVQPPDSGAEGDEQAESTVRKSQEGKQSAPQAPVDNSEVAEGDGGDDAELVFSMKEALAAVQRTPVLLGHSNGEACYASVDPDQCNIILELRTPDGGDPSPDAVDLQGSEADTPPNDASALDGDLEENTERPGIQLGDTWLPRDLGEQSSEDLRRALRRCRGVLWNGALGVRETECWQRGTKSFLAAVAHRIEGGGEDDEEEEQEDEEEDDEEREDGAGKAEEKEEDAEFELAAVIGCDSTRLLPLLMESPSIIHFVSHSGEALLHILRGRRLAGLLSCGEK